MNKRILSRIGHLLVTVLIAALVLSIIGPSPPVSAQGSQPVACVTAYRLNVRTGPSVAYPVITVLSRDQCVTLAGYRNADATWVQIILPGGGTGWVSAYYIQTTYPLNSLTVAPGPATPPPATTGEWRGEYHANRDLVGTPALVRNDGAIDFNWGLGAPAPNLPADNFSVRWTRTAQFDGATYRFRARVDDGVRLWVDGQLLIDAWQDGPARDMAADLSLSQGAHTVRVEYYEHGVFAEARVWWEKVSPPSYPDWKGEYFSNRKLEGSPKLVRNDKKLDFNWKDGRPASDLPKDDFSVRWTRTTKFDGGTYRFYAKVDDGVRLWVDGKRIIDAWEDGTPHEVSGDIALVKGNHTVKVEYYERKGDAQIRVWWEKATPTFNEWKGEYFSNRKLEGSPKLVRNDKKIDFNWKDGSPAVGLPVDNFSVRWTREVEFEPGIYRLRAKADDGVRVYIDDERVLKEWHESEGKKTYQVERELSGKHTLRVEYYEQAGVARVEFSWEKR